MKCVKTGCGSELDPSKTTKVVWQKGEDGSQFPWNKPGTFKQYENICDKCGWANHWVNI